MPPIKKLIVSLLQSVTTEVEELYLDKLSLDLITNFLFTLFLGSSSKRVQRSAR